MLLYRLEYIENGKGVFAGRPSTNAYLYNEDIKEAVNELGRKHRSPLHDTDNTIRCFEDIKESLHYKFAFTEYAFCNPDLTKHIIEVVKFNKDIRLRVINNAEIVWVSLSGIQVVFIDK